jgi:TrmH family RNA methyltransferase
MAVGLNQVMQLTSAKNPFLQSIRRAATSGRPMEDGRVVIEGPHLVREALGSRWRMEQVLVTARGAERHSDLLSKMTAEIIEIPARAFESLAGTENSQEIMALLTPPVSTLADSLLGAGVTVILDGIQDPGNAGTIVRSAEAFGAEGLIFLEGCVRVANGKFLRATAGSLFRMPYFEDIKRANFLSDLRSLNVKLFALTAQAATSLGGADLRPPCAIVVGSEAHGVSPELLAYAEGLCIPTSRVESLNAAVACSIVLFEAARQRSEV